MTGVQRVDQGMALTATRILPREQAIDETLRTRYRQLPSMVRTAGLAATYAFLLARGKEDNALGDAYRRVAKGIREHLVGPGKLINVDAEEISTDRSLLDRFATLDLPTYARASIEVEKLATWLSRLADAAFGAHKRAADSAPAGETA